MEEFASRVPGMLQAIQTNLYERALAYRDAHTRDIDTTEEFYAFFTAEERRQARDPRRVSPARIGTARPETEAKIKEDLKVTIRCIPADAPEEEGVSIVSGQPSQRRVLWAKSY